MLYSAGNAEAASTSILSFAKEFYKTIILAINQSHIIASACKFSKKGLSDALFFLQNS